MLRRDHRGNDSSPCEFAVAMNVVGGGGSGEGFSGGGGANGGGGEAGGGDGGDGADGGHIPETQIAP